jgi:murein DD-endopeptidase MepM/ murein hydrolase activator NlpD
MRKITYILIILCVLVGVTITSHFVFSEPDATGGTTEEIDALNKQIKAKQDKIKQIEDTIAKYNKSIQQKQTEAVSLQNQMSILDNKIAQAEADIEVTEVKIDQASLEVEALELTITEKERVISKQKIIVGQMVREINSEDQKNYLEILLTNNSFAEFFDQIKYLESVYTDLGKSVKTLKGIKEDLEGRKQQVVDKRQVYENLKADLENKKKDLEERNFAKQDLLIMAKSSEARYKIILASLKQEYQAEESEIQSYEQSVRQKLAEMEKQNQDLGDSTGAFAWPVPSRYITATFHDPDYPFRNVFEHSGVDIRAAQGTPIRAVAAGYVARAKRCTLASCYSYTLIVHSAGLSSLYGHMSKILVEEDQFVGRGDIIGYSGGTPGSAGSGPFVTGPHLHFEIRKNGIPVDPMGYF